MDAMSALPAGFYEGKRVFVTGHTGFKGSWLSAWLHLLGAEVTGYALPPECSEQHFAVLEFQARIRHIAGDTRDITSLRQAMAQARPEIVFHLAAQPIVSRSYREPKLTFDTNVGGSVNVLEVVRSLECVRALIYVTSDKCYLNHEWEWGYRETDELGGYDPYSASKACAELVLGAYQKSFFSGGRRIGAASVRAGNVIGGGDWAADRVVPDCVRALRANHPIALRNPSAVRPWQHVLEPLGGYLLLAARLYCQPDKYEGAWNFGPEASAHHSVAELVREVIQAWGGGSAEASGEPKGGFREASLLYLNCDKARRKLGWRPAWDFFEAARRTTYWYKQWTAGADAWQLTSSQIRAYQSAWEDRSDSIVSRAGSAA